jgi:DNA polymerase-3 subunit epsilon
MIKDSDLAGFNSDRFDIPLIGWRIDCRAGVDLDMKNKAPVDVQTISCAEERTLDTALYSYCGKS